MEIGFSTYLFARQRLSSHMLDQVFDRGIRQIEIYADRQHLDYQDLRHVRDVAQWFTDHGVSLHSVHAPLFANSSRERRVPISPAHTERRLRVESMDQIKRVIEIAEYLPFRYLVLHLGQPEDEYSLRKFDAAFTSLEHLKIFAKERGTQILLENTTDQLGTPERLVEFIQHTRLDVKVCFDVGHAHLTGGVPRAFEMLRRYTATIHMHDNRGEKDEHLMPFEGGIDWAAVVPSFSAVEGNAPALLEPGSEGSPDQMAKVQEVIRKLADIGQGGN
ncbi:MAG: sugar phosphate isomerase/epimerase family protein [Terriglobia bacterium]